MWNWVGLGYFGLLPGSSRTASAIHFLCYPLDSISGLGLVPGLACIDFSGLIVA